MQTQEFKNNEKKMSTITTDDKVIESKLMLSRSCTGLHASLTRQPASDEGNVAYIRQPVNSIKLCIEDYSIGKHFLKRYQMKGNTIRLMPSTVRTYILHQTSIETQAILMHNK